MRIATREYSQVDVATGVWPVPSLHVHALRGPQGRGYIRAIRVPSVLIRGSKNVSL
jgi:hypothetical protein